MTARMRQVRHQALADWIVTCVNTIGTEWRCFCRAP